MHFSFLSRLALALGACALVAPVLAQTTGTVTSVRRWTTPDNRANIFLDRTYSGGTTGGVTYSDYIGAQNSTLVEMIGGQSVTSVFEAYCIDADALLYRPTYNMIARDMTGYTTGRPGTAHGGAAAWLYNHYAASASSDNRQSGALQLALWEVIEDWDGTQASIDLSNGNLRYLGSGDAGLTTDINARASSMLATWNGQQDTALWIDGQDGGKDSKGRDIVNPQDLVGPTTRATPTVPEPATASLICLTVGAFVVRRRAR